MTKNATVMATLPMLKRRSRKKLSGSIGCLLRRSHHRNDTRVIAAITAAPITDAAVQPSSPPWMIAKTSALKPHE